MAVRAYNAAETKADLYARITSDGEFELLLGDFVKGDMLPALWQYDASSAATDDFANGVIRPTLQTGNGRWLRQNTTVTKAYIDGILTTMQSDINGKFPIPTGNTTQYLRGDGTTASFPSIPAAQVNTDWNSNTGVSQLLNRPTLSTVATSGAYADLSGKPSLATVATSGSYSDLSGQPTIPTNNNQLTNGAGYITSVPAQSFASLTGKPTSLSGYGITDAYPISGNPSGFLTSVPAQTWASITGKPTFATVATSGSYLDLSNRPTIKRQETYSGTTNASGNFTVTFGTAYAVAPNIQASISNQSNAQQQIRVSSVSTTGFTVNVSQRNTAFLSLLGLDILTSGTTNVSGATVDCLATEK